MYNSLYKKIIKSINKGLCESLLDDFDDIVGTDEGPITGGVMDLWFKSHILQSLCIHESLWHPVYNGEDEGLPLILEDPNDSLRFFIAPSATYTSCGFGPRKRKLYSYNYFYRYIIEFLEDGTLSLSILKYSAGKANLAINKQLYDFINKCPYKISKLLFHQAYKNEYIPFEFNGFENIYIFDGTLEFGKKNISNSFVNNFPDIITPGANINSVNKVEIKRSWFTADTYFIKFIKKLINNGFAIKDENLIIYNADNIQERENEILSGKQDLDIVDTHNNNELFIINELGQSYCDKFNKLIEYFKSKNISFELRTINTLRTCKISLNTTVYNLRKDNNMLIEEIGEYEDEDVQPLSTYYNRQICWKMLCIMKSDKLNAWNIRYDYTDCTDGYDNGWGRLYVDLNHLPLKFKNIHDVYILYHIIAKAIIECDGLYNFAYKKCLLHNINENPLYILTGEEVKTYNSNKDLNINTFNFSYLTKQLLTIIDKTCKKYKIK